MKKIMALLVIVSLVGCSKNDDYVSLSKSDKSTVLFSVQDGAPAFPRIPYTPDGSLTDEYLSFDAVTIRVKLEGPITAPEDIPVTFKIDAAALTKYNADQLAKNPTTYKPYELLPASNFSLLVTSDVIKKGEVYAEKVTNNVVTHPQLIDPAKNYMIPITVSNSTYPSVPGGSGTIFISIIGNPLAGQYNVNGYFYHPALPRAFTRTGAEGVLVPYSDKALVTYLGDLGGGAYYAVITVPDPYATTIQPVTCSTLPGGYITVIEWPTGLPTTNPGYAAAWPSSPLCNGTYNPTTKTFYLRYGYLGGTGFRVVEEVQVKQ